MRRQAVRTVALVLVALLVATGPARAATLTFADVIQAAGANGQLRPASEVRLRVNTQSGAASTQSGSAASQQTTAGTQTAQQQTTQTPSTTQSTPEGTISQSGGNVQTVDLGDVTGTVCDCGEIPPNPLPKVAGAFPWWTLAGIPLICVSGICAGGDENPPTGPTPTPTPPTNPVPEPISLFLFGTGLLAVGAGARRRYGRRQGAELNISATTEEV